MNRYFPSLKLILGRALILANLGIFQCLKKFMYGFTMTLLIRICSLLGPAQVAGLGAGMRGLEWISYSISEGFQIASAASTGQCIGANQHKRAIEAALLCAFFSTISATITCIPFFVVPEFIASLVSEDPEVIKYCGQYLYVIGFAMPAVGWEVASYGAFIGSGKTRLIFFISGCINLSRVPLAVFCLFGKPHFFQVLSWAVGFRGKELPRDIVMPPNGFYCFCTVIAFTAYLKCFSYIFMFCYRYFTGLYFSDSNLVHQSVLSS